jgi:hypothetical protein
MIRFDSFPMGGQPTGAGPTIPPTLSCLLHSGVLPPGHTLAVWVGGMPQQAESEDHLSVFSWQCGVEALMEIHLRQDGRIIRAWRGWWKGDTTLAHTGTLAIQVFCAGQPQPASLSTPPLESASSLLLSTAPERLNGTVALASAPASAPAPTEVWTWPKLSEGSLTPAPPAAPVRESDLWREEEGTREETEEEADREVDDMQEEEGWEEPDEEATEDDEGWEEEGEPAPAVPEPGQAGQAPLPTAPASPTSVVSAPASTIVAALHAASVWSQSEHERVVRELADVLAGMPARTILVDLRRHTPTPRASRRAPHVARVNRSGWGLTKDVLRTLYGARYWDRGALISTSRRPAPGKPVRWSMVVDHPESAEGLGALVTALKQGFSLLLLDSIATYAESSRAAVLAELRQRVANLEVGSCS